VAAAVTSARRGLDVVLVDKARFPRDKCCGDGLTTGALRLLEQLGLQPQAVPSWQVVDDVSIRSPSGRVIDLPLPRAQGQFAAVTPRVELDAALVDLATAAGVKVHDGHALTGASMTSAGAALEVDGLGTIAAAYVIGADGMWSPLRKHLGLAPASYLGDWHAFRQYFGGVSGPAADRLWVWFEPDLLPGYAWSFPLPDGRANVGFGVLRGDGRRIQAMKATWPDLLARPHVRGVLGPEARPEAPHKAWPIPARISATLLGRGRALFVGDAAAASDPMTGEGIAQALLTGILAAEAVADGLAGGDRHAGGDGDGTGDGRRPHVPTSAAPALVQARYEAAVRRELSPDDRMSVLLGKVLTTPLGARGAVRIAGLSDWTRRNFVRWMFEDEPRAAAFTPGRWHRRFLTRPGAFAPSP
jgi:geranylgeranyl reductase family protein